MSAPKIIIQMTDIMTKRLLTAIFTYLIPSFTEKINVAEDAFSSIISYPQTFTVAVNIIFAFALIKLLDRKRKI